MSMSPRYHRIQLTPIFIVCCFIVTLFQSYLSLILIPTSTLIPLHLPTTPPQLQQQHHSVAPSESTIMEAEEQDNQANEARDHDVPMQFKDDDNEVEDFTMEKEQEEDRDGVVELNFADDDDETEVLQQKNECL